ncbi:hypothetical protein SCLCIDRAFT_28347 [Scleroderma citrinum Foug A]|uniref:Uncharacterized protein n=1 Tax=Scleroderma citrinum Foug A TaxID=1036808 RepID=A0A0C3DPF2_9AGAM|nr:hypothetical protein SCLCIDRAFT_28347 [Scleroderma citrinum Foug A]
MAGCMNGMVKTAKPNGKLDTDVDGKATLGREPVGMVHRVNEGSKEHEPQVQLQQIEFYCEESCQHSGIAKEDVPSAQKLPLEGEWTVCTSSELLTTTVEPYIKDVDMNARICLGAMHWHANNTSHSGGRMDGSEGLTDVSRGLADGSRELMDPLGELKRAETAMLGCRDGSSMYLGPGDTKHLVNKMDGTGIHTVSHTKHVWYSEHGTYY